MLAATTNNLKKRARIETNEDRIEKKQKNESDSERLVSMIDKLLENAKTMQDKSQIEKLIQNVYYAQILWAINRNFSEIEKLLN